jgi:hypothetical protein
MAPARSVWLAAVRAMAAAARPTIGLLTVPNFLQYPTENAATLPFAADCFVPASYVKLIEAGGARVVPLPCTGDMVRARTVPVPRNTRRHRVWLRRVWLRRVWLRRVASLQTAFKELVASVNGFLFTGMYTDYLFPNSSATPYGQRGQYIVDYVVNANKGGQHVPLFAICMGYMVSRVLVAAVCVHVGVWGCPVVLSGAGRGVWLRLGRSDDGVLHQRRVDEIAADLQRQRAELDGAHRPQPR